MGIISFDSLVLTKEMVNFIAEMDLFRGTWQEMRRLQPDRLSALKKVATIESIGSSTRIEGAKLTNHQVERLLKGIDKESFLTRDEQEVAGYAFVAEQIGENYESIPLTENIIKQFHGWLLRYSDKDQRHLGKYKKIPINIEAFDSKGNSLGVVFETTSPMKTPIQMKELITWTNEALETKIWHPLIIIGIFTVIFLAIHPFQDGNGRLSRLLTNLLLLKSGYQYVLYTSLESVIEANKESYYLALQKTQTTWQENQPQWEPWLLFFFQCLQRQKHHLEIKLEKEKLLATQLSLTSQNILQLLADHGRLGISELALLTKANRNTLKKNLAILVRENYILIHGKGKGTWYTL